MRVRGASSLGYNFACLSFVFAVLLKKQVWFLIFSRLPPHLDADANVDLIRTLG